MGDLKSYEETVYLCSIWEIGEIYKLWYFRTTYSFRRNVNGMWLTIADFLYI